MTVVEWIASREPRAPDALRERLGAVLGDAGAAPAERTADVCLEAAARLVRELVEQQRFGRDSALDLLTADALMTYAYEHAATAGTVGQVQALVERGAALMGAADAND